MIFDDGAYATDLQTGKARSSSTFKKTMYGRLITICITIGGLPIYVNEEFIKNHYYLFSLDELKELSVLLAIFKERQSVQRQQSQ